MRRNLKNLLMDSNSDLVRTDIPHYYEMTLPNGSKRHCGTLKDVECILSMYPDAVYAKILLPHPPGVSSSSLVHSHSPFA